MKLHFFFFSISFLFPLFFPFSSPFSFFLLRLVIIFPQPLKSSYFNRKIYIPALIVVSVRPCLPTRPVIVRGRKGGMAGNLTNLSARPGQVHIWHHSGNGRNVYNVQTHRGETLSFVANWRISKNFGNFFPFPEFLLVKVLFYLAPDGYNTFCATFKTLLASDIRFNSWKKRSWFLSYFLFTNAIYIYFYYYYYCVVPAGFDHKPCTTVQLMLLLQFQINALGR